MTNDQVYQSTKVCSRLSPCFLTSLYRKKENLQSAVIDAREFRLQFSSVILFFLTLTVILFLWTVANRCCWNVSTGERGNFARRRGREPSRIWGRCWWRIATPVGTCVYAEFMRLGIDVAPRLPSYSSLCSSFSLLDYFVPDASSGIKYEWPLVPKNSIHCRLFSVFHNENHRRLQWI